MMAFTILYAMLILLVLIVVFGFTYKVKGLKTAFLATGIAFILSVVLLVATVYAIVSVMPN
ncbi:MAG TPA: hypothetical protein VK897_02300 [Anaerolineales bacterium]|nr:hypothetical protein [Anaerolineales bacterium]